MCPQWAQMVVLMEVLGVYPIGWRALLHERTRMVTKPIFFLKKWTHFCLRNHVG